MGMVLRAGPQGLILPGRKPSTMRLPRGITAYWPLDAANCEFGSGQVRPLDLIGNNYGVDAKSMGAAGGPPFDQGGVGYNYDATTNTYIVLNSDPLQGTTGTSINATFAIWAYYRGFAGSNGPGRLFQCTNQVTITNEDGGQGSGQPVGALILECGGGTTGKVTTAGIPLNTWTHVAVTVVAGVATEIFINGVSVPQLSGALGFSTSASNCIGSRDSTNRILDGKLAHAMVCNGTVLTADEIADLYFSIFLPDEEMPVTFLPSVLVSGLESRTNLGWRSPRRILSSSDRRLIVPGAKPTGPVIVDPYHPSAAALQAFVLHGSRQGADADLISGGLAPWIEASATVSKSGMTGFGPSRNFPARGGGTSSAGGNFFLTKTSDPSTGLGNCTLGGQFIFNTRSAGYTNVFGQSNDAVNKYCDLYISSGTDLIFELLAGSGIVIVGGPVVGVPYTVFLVKIGTFCEVFLNGVSISTFSSSSSVYDSSMNVHYGAWGTGFTSNPDDFDLLWSAGWNRALSLDEIAELMQNPYGLLVPAEGEMPTISQFTPSLGLPLMGQIWMS